MKTQIEQFINNSRTAYCEARDKAITEFTNNPQWALRHGAVKDTVMAQRKMEHGDHLEYDLKQEDADDRISTYFRSLKTDLFSASFRPNSTCPIENLVSLWNAMVDGEVVKWYESLASEMRCESYKERAYRLRVETASTVLGMDGGEPITIARYHDLKRQLRKAELELTPINALIEHIKATPGISYKGEPKAELVLKVLDHEMPLVVPTVDPELVKAQLEAKPDPEPEAAAEATSEATAEPEVVTEPEAKVEAEPAPEVKASRKRRAQIEAAIMGATA